MKEQNLITSIKIPSGLLNVIDDDIEQNKEFRNRSEWIITAIRQFLDYRTKIIADRRKAFEKEENTDDDFIPASPADIQNDTKA